MVVRRVKSQRIAHLRGPSDLILIIGFLAAFKFACETNRIHDGATIWVPLLFVKSAPTLSLKIRISAVTNIAPVVVSSQSAESLRQKTLLWSYSEFFSYSPEKFADDQVIDKMDSAISSYTPTTSIYPMHYIETLHAKSCKGADVNEKSTLKDISFEGVHRSTRHLLWKY